MSTSGSLTPRKSATKRPISGLFFVFSNRESASAIAEAKQLFEKYKADLAVIKIDGRPWLKSLLVEMSNENAGCPQFFFGDKNIGDEKKIADLEKNGTLEGLLKETTIPGERLLEAYNDQHNVFIFSPSQIYFPPPLNTMIICKLRVKNRSDNCAVWKMKLKTPERFGVKPRCGVIEAGTEEIIEAILHKPGPIEKPEVFRFESIPLKKSSHDLRNTAVIESIFRNPENTKKIQKFNLDTVVDAAPTNFRVTQYQDRVIVEEIPKLDHDESFKKSTIEELKPIQLFKVGSLSDSSMSHDLDEGLMESGTLSTSKIESKAELPFVQTNTQIDISPRRNIVHPNPSSKREEESTIPNAMADTMLIRKLSSPTLSQPSVTTNQQQTPTPLSLSTPKPASSLENITPITQQTPAKKPVVVQQQQHTPFSRKQNISTNEPLSSELTLQQLSQQTIESVNQIQATKTITKEQITQIDKNELSNLQREHSDLSAKFIKLTKKHHDETERLTEQLTQRTAQLQQVEKQLSEARSMESELRLRRQKGDRREAGGEKNNQQVTKSEHTPNLEESTSEGFSLIFVVIIAMAFFLIGKLL